MDLRRDRMQRNLLARSKVNSAIRTAVERQAAVCPRRGTGGELHPCLFHQLTMYRIIFCVDRIFAWNDFFAQKLFSGTGEHALFIGDVFGGEYVFGCAFFNQEAPALR